MSEASPKMYMELKGQPLIASVVDGTKTDDKRMANRRRVMMGMEAIELEADPKERETMRVKEDPE